jgi:broad specificity phosphatase PhoE
MATKLILIRHGETAWNAQRRYCGFKDVRLSAKGKLQAELLSKRLKAKNIDKVYTSDRKRALETAKVIFRGYRIKKIPDLGEMHFGCFEGLTYTEIMRKYPQVYARWLKEPYGSRIPGGEDLAGFRKRVTFAFKKIISLNADKTIAVVCHGGTIGIFLSYILKTKDFWKRVPHAASLSILECKNSKIKIRLFNDISHLVALGKKC